MSRQRYRRPTWPHSGQAGLTLIELLVVMAVLAVLAVSVVMTVNGRIQASGCALDVDTLQTAIDSYINDGNTAGLPATPLTQYATPAAITSFLQGSFYPQYIHAATGACQSMTLTSDGRGGWPVTTP